MISKFKHDGTGSRMAIVFNGSPLFTGAAGSGESNIRKWIIENDWLEAIVALPDQLFYNTGISTYLWIVTNRKDEKRKGKIQLINATGDFVKIRKSLGNKRNEISESQIQELTRLYGNNRRGKRVKIFDNDDFGYNRITVERPLKLNFKVDDERYDRVMELKAFQNLATSKKKKDKKAVEAEIKAGKQMQVDILSVLNALRGGKLIKNREKFTDKLKAAFKDAGVAIAAPLFKAIWQALSERDETADVCTNKKGVAEADSDLRDYENVPLKETIADYMEREVLPHVPGAWVDESKTKVGYEINFNRYFYEYKPPRPLEDIEADIVSVEREIMEMIKEVVK